MRLEINHKEAQIQHCTDWTTEMWHCSLHWGMRKSKDGFDLGKDHYVKFGQQSAWRAHLVDVFRGSPNPNTGQIVLRLAYLEASTFLKEEITMLITLWIQHLFIIKTEKPKGNKKS